MDVLTSIILLLLFFVLIYYLFFKPQSIKMTDSFGNEIVIPPDNVCYNFMSNHLNNRSGDLVFRGSNFVLKSPN